MRIGRVGHVGFLLAGLLLALLVLQRGSARFLDRSSAGVASGPTDENATPPAPISDDRRPVVVDRPLPDGDTLVIRTVAPDGEAVGHAELWLERDLVLERLGTTDATGRARVERDELLAGSAAVRRLLARRRGFASAERLVSPAWDEPELLLTLSPPASIRGRVLTVDGGPPPVPIQILAIPERRALSMARDPERVLAEHPSILRSESAADGSFELRDVRPGAVHDLLAGGPGLVTDGQLRVAAGTEVELTVHPGFLVVVECRDAVTGECLRGTPCSGDGAALTWRIDGDASCRFKARLDASLALAGAPVAALQRPFGTYLHALVSDDSGSTGGRLRLGGELPGYEPVGIELDVPRIGVADPFVTVLLTPDPRTSWGTLVVALHGTAALDPPSPRLVGILHLRSDGGRRLLYPLALDARNECSLREVPCGAYDAFVEFDRGLCAYPLHGSPPERIVVEQAGARFEVHLEQSGSVRFSAMSPAGEPYVDDLSLLLCSGEPEIGSSGELELEGTTVTFAGGEYRVTALDPARYTYYVQAPVGDRIVSGSFDVRSGTTVHVPIELATPLPPASPAGQEHEGRRRGVPVPR